MKNKTKQRTKEVKVRLTEGELARLNDNVALTGLSREQYLRLLIIHKTPTALPPADYRLLLRQMQWMETQLKELAGNQSTDESREQLDYTLQLLNSTVLLMQGGHAAPDVFALHPQHTRWKGGKSLWRVCRLIPATLPTN